MALNTSGPISLGGSTSGQSIALELGQSATAQISLNDTSVRTLAGVSSGAITMPTNFYGKSSVSVPGAPTGVSAATPYSGAASTAVITYTAPTNNGGATITSYTAVSSPGGITASVSTSGSGTITMTGLNSGTSYTFTVYCTNSAGNSASSSASNSMTALYGRQAMYTTAGTYTWVCPSGVSRVSVVAVGAGGGGGDGDSSAGGGAGGNLRYMNNISVTAGSSYTLVVGTGGARGYAYYCACIGNYVRIDGTAGGNTTISSFGLLTYGGGGGGNSSGQRNNSQGSGGTFGGYGGYGGQNNGDGGGGGAGGYSGNGGTGGTNFTANTGVTAGAGGAGGGGGSGAGGCGGGSVGLKGEGASGVAGLGGAPGFGNHSTGGAGSGGGPSGAGPFYSTGPGLQGKPYNTPGGGGGGGYGGGQGGDGGIRIIWPGSTRLYPSTNTADQ